MTLYTICFWIVFAVIFVFIDPFYYIKTPFEYRKNYWWRFLPTGGVAVYLKWKRESK